MLGDKLDRIEKAAVGPVATKENSRSVQVLPEGAGKGIDTPLMVTAPEHVLVQFPLKKTETL